MEQQDKSKPMTLLRLPPEIQTKIFSHLAVAFGKSNIQAVLRCCKQLYGVALPISVSIFRNTVHYMEGGGLCSPLRNAQFLRYILISKPWLAKHVKMVIMGSLTSEAQEGGQHENLSTDEDLAIYQQQIERILSPLSEDTAWRTEWIEDLQKGCSDAQFTLILLTCLNIRTLLFEQSIKPRHFHRLLGLLHGLFTARKMTCVTGWNRNNGAEIVPLSNIQDVFHEANDQNTGYGHFNIEAPALFALPQLRFYECILPHGNNTAAENFRRLPSRSSLVEEINLHTAYATGPMLRNMLDVCKSLRKFEYIRGMYGMPNEAMPRDILDAILPHANTLEYLYINLEEDWDKQWNWQKCPERLYMGAELRKMHVLKKLTIGMQALTGMFGDTPENHDSIPPHLQMPIKIEGASRLVECLPDNLEYLKIHGCDRKIVSEVKELVGVIEEGRFKKLTYIGLLFQYRLVNTVVDLGCDLPHVFLDIGYQVSQMVMFDLGRADAEEREGGRSRNLTSRIYSENRRRHYLGLRGATKYLPCHRLDEDRPDLFEE